MISLLLWEMLKKLGKKHIQFLKKDQKRRAPPALAPSEVRFTDWSSLESPHVRMQLQSVLVEETGPDINQPVNQTTQLGSEPAQIGAMGNALQDDIIVSSPRTH